MTDSGEREREGRQAVAKGGGRPAAELTGGSGSGSVGVVVAVGGGFLGRAGV